IGADHVFTEEEFKQTSKEFVKSIKSRPKLALNGVGGKSALQISSVLERGGTCVTYGGMSKKAHEFTTSALVFNDIQVLLFLPKTSSKTLGRLMIKGGAVPARQTSINQNGESGVVASETTANNIKKRVGEELNQLDIDSFESVLQDAASSKRIFPKNDSSSPEHESSSNQVDFNIMSLIENTKRQAASNGTSTKDSVKFDDVDEFIDEGADDVVIGKPPNKPIHLMNVTSPIRGNPVTDYDRLPETNGVSNIGVHDPFSRMEMGHQTLPQDILNAERIRNSQKNVRCDENEQLNYIHEKGLNEYSRFDTILGPASHGEFASFSQNLTPVISCELGALNPVSMNAMQHFQTLTPNGRLLPAIPRKYFSSNENHQRITTRPAPQKSPVTIMLQTTAPSFHNTTSADSNMANVHSGTPISSVIPSAVVEAQLSPESASSKKKAKKAAAKKAKAAKEAADAENVVIEGEERNDINENDDKKDTEEAAIGETVTDQNKASGQTKSKAQKAKDKKKAKKEQDEMKDIGRDEEKNDSSLVGIQGKQNHYFIRYYICITFCFFHIFLFQLFLFILFNVCRRYPTGIFIFLDLKFFLMVDHFIYARIFRSANFIVSNHSSVELSLPKQAISRYSNIFN
ncbi:Protein CBG13163, partial [Caenorhabditis briggsae]